MNKTKRVLSLVALVLSLTFVFAMAGISVAAEEATEATTVAASAESVADETSGAAEEESSSTTGTEESKGLTEKDIINLIVGGVLLVALIVLCIVFRHKIPGWFRSVKSECKKIVWCPKEQLKHSSIVVLVTIIALVVVLFALDSVIPVLIGWADTGIDALMALITKK